MTSNWQKNSFQAQNMTRNAMFRTLQKSSPLGCNSQYLYLESWKSALLKKKNFNFFHFSPHLFWVCLFHPYKKRTTQTQHVGAIAHCHSAQLDSLLHLRFLTHLSWANATFDELLFRRWRRLVEGGRRNDWGAPVVGPPKRGVGFLGFAN